MRGHDIIVVGASAGGVETSRQVVAGLPPDLPASVFLVVHLPAEARSILPEILTRAGPLPASHPEDGQAFEHGHIYVARPDRHLVLDPEGIGVRRGPFHNRHRPAVDPLFRSAALHFGSRVIGVILSGTLDDGTAGLMTIKRRGGIAVVQDPERALFSGMPASAIQAVAVDHVEPADAIGPLLGRLATIPAPELRLPPEPRLVEEMRKYDGHVTEMESIGRPSKFACPECNGVLWEFDEDGILQFACRVGHSYTSGNLVADQETRLENTLWAAVRALEESADLRRRVAERLTMPGSRHIAERSLFRAAQSERHAEELRRWLERDEAPAETPAEEEA